MCLCFCFAVPLSYDFISNFIICYFFNVFLIIYIINTLLFPIGIPAVSVESLYYDTTYGQQVKLECTITAYPPVTLVYWQKNIGDVITILNEGTVGTKGINVSMPSLIIMFPKTADSGSYTCFGSNVAGTQRSLAVKLNVEGGMYFL